MKGRKSDGGVGAMSDEWYQHTAGGDHDLIITESTHLCGYPNCDRRFRFKHDLLRHQTKMHGRQPVNARKSTGTAALEGTIPLPVNEMQLATGYF